MFTQVQSVQGENVAENIIKMLQIRVGKADGFKRSD